MGDVFLTTSSSIEPTFVQDMLNVPRITTNLLSVYRIAEQASSVYFDIFVLEFNGINNLQIVVSGTKEGGLY